LGSEEIMIARSCTLLALLVLAAFAPAAAQGRSPIVGVAARFGVGTSGEASDGTINVGLEGELFPSGRWVPGVRFDGAIFGFNCVGLGPCPNQVTTLTAGLRLRATEAGRFVPYVGVDAGRMWWNSDARGWAWHARVGGDIELARFVALVAELSFLGLKETTNTLRGTPADGLTKATAGVRLRI
jgi:hypothetical protein